MSGCWQRATLAASFILMSALGCSETTPIAPTASTGGGNPASREKGAREAAEAIAAGKLLIKEYPPLPSPAWQANYIRLLKERCGVDYEVPQLPAGVSEADFREEIHGFNQVMQAEIRRRFGENVFEELQAESRQRKGRKGKVIIG
jgi:hypothetical protein